MNPPARFLALHQRNNRLTAGAWAPFAGHRERLTELARAGCGGGSLLVLGAGNLNDLELARLVPPCERVHLADLDAAALAAAAARQPEAVRATLALHAPVDLGGALHRLEGWARARPTEAQLAALPARAAEQVAAALPGGHDLVLSSCLLTQLFLGARTALGAGHPQLAAVAGALAAGHLRAMALLGRPGGTALLATDVVSSESYPLEELYGARDPLALLGELTATGNCFTGADPSFLLRLLAEHPDVAPLVEAPRLEPPWLWTMSDEVTLLVYAIAFRRRG